MSEKKKDKKIVQTLLFEVLFFCLVLALGLFSAMEAKLILIESNIEVQKINFEGFLFYFLIVTVFVLAITYFRRIGKYRGAIYKFLFVFAFVYGALTVFSLYFIDIITIALILILLFLWFKVSSVWVHDIVMILSLAGIGAIFGLAMEPRVVVLLLLVLSVYDFIAVYKTKHMIKMAKSMLSHGVIMGLIIPKELKDFKERVTNISPSGRFMVLGGGDIIFPLVFSVSLLDKGIISVLIVAGFSLFGLITSLLVFLLQKEQKPIPALPPIALFSIIGYIITLI